MLDATRDEPGSLAGHLGEVVGDRRQLDDRPRRGRQVVEADDRDLFGDGDPGPARGIECAVRDDVVSAEDHGRRGGQGEQRCRRLVARLRVERAAPHVLRVQGEAVLRERRTEGDLAGLRGAGVARPENGADAPVTQGDGARGGRGEARCRRDDGGVRVDERGGAIEVDEGQAAVAQPQRRHGIDGRRGQDHPVETVRDQSFRDRLVVGGLGVQHELIAHALEFEMDRRDDLRVELVLQIRHEQSDAVGAAR